MPKDKYTATWVSHTSINDFLTCPRSYYLKRVYRDPNTNNKIQLMSPPLALGSAVHEVIESLSELPVEERFNQSLLEKFNQAWKQVSGKRGGFVDASREDHYKEQGRQMLKKIQQNPGPIERLAVKIKAESDLPRYWLSDEDEIILCGKIDWLEYLPDTDSVHIIDFKTSKTEEDQDSLQLPIYHLLVHNTQKRQVDKASYWYLRFSDKPDEQELPDLDEAHDKVLRIAKKIKLAKKLENFKCPHGEQGCYACRPLERVVAGEAELVGVNDFGNDVYILPDQSDDIQEKDSVIL